MDAEERRGSFFILLLGFMAFFLLPPGTRLPEGPHGPGLAADRRDNDTKTAAASETTPEVPDSCEGNLRRVVNEYFGEVKPQTFRAQNTRPSILIATVPDPLDSGHDYYFDRTVESIQAAAGLGGNLLRDRSWLPWNDVRARNVAEARDARECRRTHPGVIFYRPEKSRQQADGLAVLLVGETPTWGIHPRALKRALEFFEEHGPPPTPDRPLLNVSIAGPTYSGTAYSLRRSLDEWQRGLHTKLGSVRIITGSATNESLGDILGSKKEPSITFQTLIVPDNYLSQAFYDFLVEDLKIEFKTTRNAKGKSVRKLEQVALLHEGMTLYGNIAAIGAQSGRLAAPRRAIRRVARCSSPREDATVLSSLRDVSRCGHSPSDSHGLPLCARAAPAARDHGLRVDGGCRNDRSRDARRVRARPRVERDREHDARSCDLEQGPRRPHFHVGGGSAPCGLRRAIPGNGAIGVLRVLTVHSRVPMNRRDADLGRSRVSGSATRPLEPSTTCRPDLPRGG